MKTRNIKPKRMSEMMNVPSSEKVYPKLTLSFKDLPEAEDWEVGEDYVLEITVRMSGKVDNENTSEATFEIKKVAIDDDEEEDLDEEEEGEEGDDTVEMSKKA